MDRQAVRIDRHTNRWSNVTSRQMNRLTDGRTNRHKDEKTKGRTDRWRDWQRNRQRVAPFPRIELLSKKMQKELKMSNKFECLATLKTQLNAFDAFRPNSTFSNKKTSLFLLFIFEGLPFRQAAAPRFVQTQVLAIESFFSLSTSCWTTHQHLRGKNNKTFLRQLQP